MLLLQVISSDKNDAADVTYSLQHCRSNMKIKKPTTKMIARLLLEHDS